MVENEEKNSRLFYLIIALIVLGFIASLAFPINAQEHKLGDAAGLKAGGFVPATASDATSTPWHFLDRSLSVNKG